MAYLNTLLSAFAKLCRQPNGIKFYFTQKHPRAELILNLEKNKALEVDFNVSWLIRFSRTVCEEKIMFGSFQSVKTK